MPRMSDEGAFVQAFKAEMNAGAHDALVELHLWANSIGFGRSPEQIQAAEKWAAEIEAAGATWDVLHATAERSTSSARPM